MNGHDTGDEVAEALIHLDGTRLEHLELTNNRLGAQSLTTLGKLQLTNLRILDLSYNDLRDDEIGALLANRSLVSLTQLVVRNLGHQALSDKVVFALAGARHLTNLRSVRFDGTFTTAAAEALAREPHLANLSLLWLWEAPHEAREILRNSPYLRNCQVLTT